MQQKISNLKPKRSAKFRLIFILLFLVLSILAAYSYNFCFPIQYKSLAKISLISDKKNEVNSFVDDLKKLSSQKEFQNEIVKSLNDKEDYSEIYNTLNIFEAKTGIAHIEFNGKNAIKIDKYITSYIKNVENYFYSKAKKTNKSNAPNIDEKQTLIDQIKNDIKSLKEKLESLPEPKIIKVIEHK